MAKITSKANLVVGTELTINTTARTIKLNVAGNLVAKDGVTIQALYSKFIDLWTTSTYNDFPFPFYYIDSLSGQFAIGTDGSKYNTWQWADDSTRTYLRDGGWSEYVATSPGTDGTSATGSLGRQYVGIISLGSVSSGAQLYYQKVLGGPASNFTFTDAANEGIQVFGDIAVDPSTTTFDSRSYFKGYVRESGKKFKDSVLADTGKSGTGAYIVNLLLSNEDDLKITAADGSMSGGVYANILVTYYGTNQNRTIGGTAYPFTVEIDGNNATLEQIYTKCQYLLRQATDIDSGAGSVIGKTANQLCYFTGDTLYTTQGVYIKNIQNADSNRIVFMDQNGVNRTNPYTASGAITFNSNLVGAGSYYRMYFASGYGTASAITVNDATPDAITGTIGTSSISFTFDYDNNIQGGRTAGTDAAVVVVAGRPGYAKPVVITGTLTKSKAISLSATAETDRAYL